MNVPTAQVDYCFSPFRHKRLERPRYRYSSPFQILLAPSTPPPAPDPPWLSAACPVHPDDVHLPGNQDCGPAALQGPTAPDMQPATGQRVQQGGGAQSLSGWAG